MPAVRGEQGTAVDQFPPIKLLFDQNLSYRLPQMLSDVYPGAAHVRDFSLERADDEAVWSFAQSDGFTIVSKDSDFHHFSFLRGAPPRVVGNCSTDEIEAVLRANAVRVIAFHRDPMATFLILP